MEENKEQENWIHLAHAAKYLGISIRTALRWIESGFLPAYKMKHIWLLKVSEIDNAIRSKRQIFVDLNCPRVKQDLQTESDSKN